MDKHELQQLEPQSSNGWQNIGICYTYAIENVPFKLQSMFMQIVRHSFGYMQIYTKRMPQEEWCIIVGVSKPTFNSQIKQLVELGHIKINISTTYVKGGGSDAFSYSPAFPRGYGQLKFKEEQAAGGSNELTTIIYDPKSDI